MEYIRAQCQPRDGKLLAIGHSMGGILLYAKLSSCCKSHDLLFYFFCNFSDGALLLFIHDLFGRYIKIQICLVFGASLFTQNLSWLLCVFHFLF